MLEINEKMSEVPSNTGLYKHIRKKYNSNMVFMIRQYVKTTQKLASMKQHLHFNFRAKRYNIVPKSLRVKPLVNNEEGKEIAARSSKSFEGKDFPEYQDNYKFRK